MNIEKVGEVFSSLSFSQIIINQHQNPPEVGINYLDYYVDVTISWYESMMAGVLLPMIMFSNLFRCSRAKQDSHNHDSDQQTRSYTLPCTQQVYYLDADRDGYGGYVDGHDKTLIACNAPENYTIVGGDCDDADLTINPDAQEICNGIDDNCNDDVDEGLLQVYYHDTDADGYGGEADYTCAPRNTDILVSGDCNDNDRFIYPGAPETEGDCIDSNCDGYGSASIKVGCPDSNYATIQDAVNHTSSGMTVMIGAGTYAEAVNISGKTIKIVSDGEVVISGNGYQRALTVTNSAVTITGVDFKNSYSSSFGGAIYVDKSTFNLSDSIVSDNYSEEGGGGLYISGYGDDHIHSNYITLQSVEITNNDAQGSGGGLYVYLFKFSRTSFFWRGLQ